MTMRVSDSEKIPVRRVFNGKGQLLIKADEEGNIKITASSDNLIQDAVDIAVSKNE